MYKTSPQNLLRRILRGGLLEDSSGWSIVPSILAATTIARLRSHLSLVFSDRIRSCPDLPDLS